MAESTKTAEILRERFAQVAAAKSSWLCVAVDIIDAREALEFIRKIAPSVAAVKLHPKIMKFHPSGYTEETFLEEVYDWAQPCEMNFMVVLDYKYSDIGNTVANQFKPVAKYADFVTIHCISGPGIIDAMRQLCEEHCVGLLPVAQMSSKGNLITTYYTNSTVTMGYENRDIVPGFIAQDLRVHFSTLPESYDPKKFMVWTPGIKLLESTDSEILDSSNISGDSLGQQYNTPQRAKSRGTDVIIVGRGITEADDPVVAAKKYNVGFE